MYIEIHRPELETRVRQQIESGGFHNVDDLLASALDALDERRRAVVAAGSRRSGADLIVALQRSPFREVEIEPERYRLSARDVDL